MCLRCEEDGSDDLLYHKQFLSGSGAEKVNRTGISMRTILAYGFEMEAQDLRRRPNSTVICHRWSERGLHGSNENESP